MSDEAIPEARGASEESGALPAPAPPDHEGGSDPTAPADENGQVVRRRRRRGSRGGRNRRRPGGASGDGQAGSTEGGDDEDLTDTDTETDTAAEADAHQAAPEVEPTPGAEPSPRRRQSSRPPRRAPARASGGLAAEEGGEATAPDADGGATSREPGTDAEAEEGAAAPRRRATRSPRKAAAPTTPDGRSDPAPRRTRPEAGGSAPSSPPTRSRPSRSKPAASEAPAAEVGNGAAAEAGTAETEESASTRRRRRRGRGSGSGSGVAPPAAEVTTTRPRGRTVTAAADKARQSAVEAVLDELDEAALERRKGRTRKGRPTGRYLMCVHVRPGVGIQVAVLEGRSLVEHYVSRPTETATAIDGNIYLGKVQNVLPGMEAAFVDIGTPKNGVLYRDDVVFDESEIEGRRPKIERLLRNGQSVIVQVTKNPIGTKGARLTQEISLAGRFVVMIPNQPGTYGISKRLADDERKRLRKILDEIRPAENGLIVRTAAEGASAEELARDLKRLSAQWEDISKRAARGKPAFLLHQEPDLAIRVIREEFNKEYRGVVIDDIDLYEEVRRYVEAITPELADRVELYTDTLPIFERYHVHEQLHKALERKVWLPSGGSIIIERTEALTVIDVNTAKNVGRSNLEETVFQNNLEAAEEVARQLRLRDIGGIIVIDFIDMEIKKNREEVLRTFKESLARDKTRTQVFDISELGLVEMTRKRISEGLVEAFSTICTTCEGRGIILDNSLL
jgi:ribonuclease E